MFTDTVTLFNFHEKSRKWYPTVLPGVELQVDTSLKLSTPGTVDNADAVTLLIQSKRDKTVNTANGSKAYLGPKLYAQCDTPEAHITFKPECDFFYEGAWPSTDPIVDDDYESGFYHEANTLYDGVYAVKTAAFLKLIPHFEIGGR